MSQTLFEITDNIRALDKLLEANDGVVDDEIGKQIIEVLVNAEGKFADKADNYATLIKEYEGRVTIRMEEADRIAHRAQVDSRAATAMKERLQLAMEMLNVRKMETSRFKLGIQKNGGKAPLIMDDDVMVNLLPDELCSVVRSVDKTAVRELIDAGETLPGFTIGERGESLRIR